MRFSPVIAPTLCLLAGFTGIAQAQAPRVERSGDDPNRLVLPEFKSQTPGAVDLPPIATLPAESGNFNAAFALTPTRILVSGVTVFPASKIEEITAPSVGRRMTMNDILALRDKLTDFYVNNGYVTSGASIPDQDSTDGTLRFEVTEGRLDAPVVTGLKHLRPGYVAARMRGGSDEIVRQEVLQERFQTLIADPNITKIEANLAPGETPGRSALTLNVTEAPRASFEAEIATDRSPSVGGERLALRGTVRNLIAGYGERLAAEVGRSEGLTDGSATFTAPFGARGAELYIHGDGSDAEVIEEPLNELDIISNSWSAAVGGSVPLWRRFGRAITLGAEIAHTQSDTGLGGAGFSFSPGAVNGRTRVTTGTLSQDIVIQGPLQVIAARSAFTFGLDALESAPGPTVPSEKFLVWRGQAQFARRTTQSGQQFIFRIDGQWTDDPLYATEKFAFGGLDSVRGYRKNEGLADKGVVASVEYRLPLGDVAPIGWLGRNLNVGAFIEGGKGWNARGIDPQYNELASAGLSAALRLGDRASLSVAWAEKLKDAAPHGDKGIQDSGFTLRLLWRGV